MERESAGSYAYANIFFTLFHVPPAIIQQSKRRESVFDHMKTVSTAIMCYRNGRQFSLLF